MFLDVQSIIKKVNNPLIKIKRRNVLAFLCSYLSENPYYCDCDLVWFVKALEKKSLKIEIADLDRMKCAVPKRMKGKMVKGLTKNDVCPDGKLSQRYYTRVQS